MKKLILILILSVTSSNILLAQASHTRLLLSGGLSSVHESYLGQNSGDFLNPQFSVKNFKKLWDPRFNLSAGIERDLTGFLMLTADFSFHQFSLNKSEISSRIEHELVTNNGIPFNSGSLTQEGGEVDFYLLTLGIKSVMNVGKLGFFIQGGAGMAYLKMKKLAINYYDQPFSDSADIVMFYSQENADNTTAFQMTGGLGLEYKIHPSFRIFTAFDYTLAFTKKSSTLFSPIRFGLIMPLN